MEKAWRRHEKKLKKGKILSIGILFAEKEARSFWQGIQTQTLSQLYKAERICEYIESKPYRRDGQHA